MMFRISDVTRLSCVLALAAAADAQTSRPHRGQAAPTSRPSFMEEIAKATTGRDAGSSARKFRKLEVGGEQVARNVERLRSELKWYSTLGGALQAGRRSGKPVLWIQALGDIDGFL